MLSCDWFSFQFPSSCFRVSVELRHSCTSRVLVGCCVAAFCLFSLAPCLRCLFVSTVTSVLLMMVGFCESKETEEALRILMRDGKGWGTKLVVVGKGVVGD